MKNISLLISFLLISYLAVSQVKSDTINNSSVIKMTKSKLGDKIILSKINTSPFKFDVSTDALINLKQNNVSDTVVNLMVYKQALIEKISDQNISANSDGDNYIFKASGIYFKKGEKYTSLDPTLVTSATGKGIFSARSMAQIEGDEANYQFDQIPEIYFNFEPVKKELNKSNANATWASNKCTCRFLLWRNNRYEQ